MMEGADGVGRVSLDARVSNKTNSGIQWKMDHTKQQHTTSAVFRAAEMSHQGDVTLSI